MAPEARGTNVTLFPGLELTPSAGSPPFAGFPFAGFLPFKPFRLSALRWLRVSRAPCFWRLAGRLGLPALPGLSPLYGLPFLRGLPALDGLPALHALPSLL